MKFYHLKKDVLCKAFTKKIEDYIENKKFGEIKTLHLEQGPDGFEFIHLTFYTTGESINEEIHLDICYGLDVVSKLSEKLNEMGYKNLEILPFYKYQDIDVRPKGYFKLEDNEIDIFNKNNTVIEKEVINKLWEETCKEVRYSYKFSTTLWNLTEEEFDMLEENKKGIENYIKSIIGR